ncbi:HAD family hydrolase [Umezawaea beigongshangensis]|uniref:HAD family hydrolase n=1 Tax=Umezawaea beigongshangensis TaxID=2780383 RepID=UPI0018F12259|nr:HAD-IA family hydrolase [Umezawaea beigongshangensis]
MTETHSAILDKAKAVFFDFDGPICSVFAGHAADGIASDLIAILRQHETVFRPAINDETDPMDVLRWTGAHKQDSLLDIEDYLVEAEIKAVESAEPTPFAVQVMRHIVESGRPVAVVSNNSTAAIHRYLVRHNLDNIVSFISGRVHADPASMKPNPLSLTLAADQLGVSITDTVLIGDTATDIEASHAAGAKSIGYANKPGKRETLSRAGAHAIIESMTALL